MIPLEAIVALARREGKKVIHNGKVIYEPPKKESEQCPTENQKQDSQQKGESSK